MGGRNSIIGNQEAFIKKNLNDLQFKIPEEEVHNIQTGIETLVHEIVNDISTSFESEIERIKPYILYGRKEKSGFNLKERTNSEKLIKAGSFYEGTKNYFPNEFDFVFLLGTYEVTDGCALSYFFDSGRTYYGDTHKQLLNILRDKHLKRDYTYHFQNDFSICYMHHANLSGPALKLPFVYKKEKKSNIEISVDIVPAFKFIDPFLTEDVLNKVNICSIVEFHRFIAETGSYIVISHGNVSFVETEKRFISTILSPQHRDVYRLVKHLINGNDKQETLKTMSEECAVRNMNISSFIIKSTLIWHHFRCKYDSQNVMHRYSHVCAGEIILDLQEHVSNSNMRHILSCRDGTQMPVVEDHRYPEYREFRILGSKYLMALGESLNPEPGREREHLDFNVDKSYLQYMIGNGKKLKKLIKRLTEHAFDDDYPFQNLLPKT